MYTPQVSKYEVGPNTVTICFTDGHKAVWLLPTGGWGIPYTIAQIRLADSDGAVKATYNSPHQYPRTTSPNGFTTATYPVERILAYWQEGYDHLAKAWRKSFDGTGPSDKLRSAYLPVSHSYRDLQDIRNGR